MKLNAIVKGHVWKLKTFKVKLFVSLKCWIPKIDQQKGVELCSPPLKVGNILVISLEPTAILML